MKKEWMLCYDQQSATATINVKLRLAEHDVHSICVDYNSDHVYCCQLHGHQEIKELGLSLIQYWMYQRLSQHPATIQILGK
jgi:hypothetical protein